MHVMKFKLVFVIYNLGYSVTINSTNSLFLRGNLLEEILSLQFYQILSKELPFFSKLKPQILGFQVLLQVFPDLIV